MNKKLLVLSQVAALLVLAGCGSENTSSTTPSSTSSSTVISSTSSSSISSTSSSSATVAPTKERIVSLLTELDQDKVTSYDFVDRSYAYNFYNNSKYIVSGNIQTGLINYQAKHKFQLFNNQFISDEITIDSLDGVETTKVVETNYANGQIYQEGNYIYDYFICTSLYEQSFVNCNEIDYYNQFDTYFNYLSIIDTIKDAFNNPTEYFPVDDGYETPVFDATVQDGVEHYALSCVFPGADDYKPIIINFSVDYETSTKEFVSIDYKIRSLLDSLDTDYEIGTSSITSYNITNLKFGDKTNFDGVVFTFDDIPSKSSIHNAPKEVIDVSDKEDGALDEETALEIIKNIYAYSNDVRQTNYSMIYHDAFDFATTDRTTFGDAKFEGKIIAYNNGITDNNGTIQLVDSENQPTGTPAPYRIFTKATSIGIFRGGKFTKYITSAFGYASKTSFTSAREYLDANPLYWSEISSILEGFSTYALGSTTFESGTTIDVSVSGAKSGTSLEIKGQLHSKTSNGLSVENIDSFTFSIEDGKLMYCKFVTMGQTSSSVKYEDTYEARFVHAPKVDFTGTEMDILNEIETQITMDDFKII